jgi:hypothetical protein
MYAPAAIHVSKPWFSVLTSHHLHVHIVGPREWNDYCPHLPAPPLLESQAVKRQQGDAAAPAFLELPDEAGGAVPYSISLPLRMRTMRPVDPGNMR